MRTKLPPGHGWAYLGLLLGLAGSVAGNVANTVLTEEAKVPLELRIPFAVAWPVFTYVGIEVLTRIEWESNWRHWSARAFLMGPMTLVAAFVSYLHLHHLMILAKEPGLAQAVGPLAIDGTLFGCTVALLVTRSRQRTQGAESRTLAQKVSAMRSTIRDLKEAVKVPAASVLPEGFTSAPVLSDVPLGPVHIVSPWDIMAEVQDIQRDPVQDLPATPTRVPVSQVRRVVRSRGSWDVEKAVQLLLEGVLKDQDVADLVGIGPKVIQRTRRAVQLLKEDPKAEVPADWKVPAAVVEVIRTEVAR
jgi:hypothetical protein